MGDSDGNWLAVAVVPASAQERDTSPALDEGKAAWSGAWPGLRVAIFDGAFAARRCREWSDRHGMRHEPFIRRPGQKDFAVQRRRWAVERGFGWLARRGGPLRGRAGRPDAAAARVACAAVACAAAVFGQGAPRRRAPEACADSRMPFRYAHSFV
jgi:putative transposase